MMYGDLFGDYMTAPTYQGSWTKVFLFDYVEDASVQVELLADFDVPFGSSLDFVANGEFTLINGEKNTVVISGEQSGLVGLAVEIKLSKNSIEAFGPLVRSIDIDVSQSVSLATIASDVLRKASLPFGSKWIIDQALYDIFIPYSLFQPQTFFNAIDTILDSCGGLLYQDRRGDLRLTIPKNTNGNGLSLIEGELYDVQSTTSEVINRVVVEVNPLEAGDEQEVWRLLGGDIIFADEVKTYDAIVTDYPGVVDVSARIASTGIIPATIEDVKVFSYGARITVKGGEDMQTVGLFLDGKPLTVVGQVIVDRKNLESIRRNGERLLEIRDNPLCQVAEVAEMVADMLLFESASPRRDFIITWRGLPNLEIGDRLKVGNMAGNITGQDIEFNGSLKMRTTIRRG
jgi:hypothetical protein